MDRITVRVRDKTGKFAGVSSSRQEKCPGRERVSTTQWAASALTSVMKIDHSRLDRTSRALTDWVTEWVCSFLTARQHTKAIQWTYERTNSTCQCIITTTGYQQRCKPIKTGAWKKLDVQKKQNSERLREENLPTTCIVVTNTWQDTTRKEQCNTTSCSNTVEFCSHSSRLNTTCDDMSMSLLGRLFHNVPSLNLLEIRSVERGICPIAKSTMNELFL